MSMTPSIAPHHYKFSNAPITIQQQLAAPTNAAKDPALSIAQAAIQQQQNLVAAKTEVDIDIAQSAIPQQQNLVTADVDIDKPPLTTHQIAKAEADIHIDTDKLPLTTHQMAELAREILSTLTIPTLLDMVAANNHESLRQHVLNRHSYLPKLASVEPDLSDPDLAQKAQRGDVLILNNEAEQQAMFQAIAQVAAQLIQLNDDELQQQCAVSCYIENIGFYEYKGLVTEIRIPVAKFPQLAMFKTHKCYHTTYTSTDAKGNKIYEPVARETISITIINHKTWCADSNSFSKNNVPKTIYPGGKSITCRLFDSTSGIVAELKEQDRLASQQRDNNYFEQQKLFRKREWQEQQVMRQFKAPTPPAKELSIELWHGQKSMQYDNGDSYDGEWRGGLRYGKGKMSYHDHHTYEGEWLQDQRHGPDSIITFDATGVKYHSAWAQDQLIQIQYPPEAQTWYNCNFANNIPHGPGRLTISEATATTATSIISYEGEWDSGNLNHGTIKYHNGNTYEGPLLNGQPHGTGTMTCANGAVYRGSWPQNIAITSEQHPVGDYEVTYRNGNKFVGTMLADGPAVGGIFTYPERHCYKTCKIIERNPDHSYTAHPRFRGELVYADGKRYVGWLKDPTRDGEVSLINGQGQLFYTNGDSYDGKWLGGFRYGKGKMSYHDHHTYEGEWLKDQRHDSYSIITFDATGVKYHGAWAQDRLIKIQYPPEAQTWYNCNFANNIPHGPGRLTISEATATTATSIISYEGEWDSGNLNHGTIKYHNGNTYEGPLLNGQPHGTGTMTCANGAVYRGSWPQNIAITSEQHPVGDYEVTYRNGNKFVGTMLADGPAVGGIFTYPERHCYKTCKIIERNPDHSYTAHPRFRGELVYADGKRYVGWLKDPTCDGQAYPINGQGQLFYANGNSYSGNIVNGIPEGQGQLTEHKADGTIWVTSCEWRNGEPVGTKLISKLNTNEYRIEYPNGRNFVQSPAGGIFSYSSSHKYRACVVMDKNYDARQPGAFFRGHIVYWYDSRTYTGLMQDPGNGEMILTDTNGQIKYANGTIYNGNILNGLPEGDGKLTVKTADGTIWVTSCKWQNGKHDGGTRVSSKLNTNEYIIVYSNGNVFTWQPNGGIFSYKNSLKHLECVVTDNNYDARKPNVLFSGRLVYRDNTIFEGFMHENGNGTPVLSENHKCTIIFANGDKYKGCFQNAKAGAGRLSPNGVLSDVLLNDEQGEFIYADGSIYRGPVHNAKPDGIGTLTKHNIDGTVITIRGVWDQQRGLIKEIK